MSRWVVKWYGEPQCPVERGHYFVAWVERKGARRHKRGSADYSAQRPVWARRQADAKVYTSLREAQKDHTWWPQRCLRYVKLVEKKS